MFQRYFKGPSITFTNSFIICLTYKLLIMFKKIIILKNSYLFIKLIDTLITCCPCSWTIKTSYHWTSYMIVAYKVYYQELAL